ncbi:DinB family protein [Marinoscillum furvescens]|nr:DinB family protein [Marinoscillum furvescens]
MKNFITLIVFLSAVAAYAADPEPKSQYVKDILPVWEVSTQNALAVARAMPADLYDFKPSDSSMTFSEQIVHIAYTSLWLTQRFAADQVQEYSQPDFSGKSKEEVVAYLEGNLKKATELLVAMPEEKAQEEVKVFSGKMLKRYVALMFVQDHLANHRAKANLYIRMNDIKPPAYGFF